MRRAIGWVAWSAPVAGGGDALYALVAPAPQGEVDPTCAADAPCAIERLDPPPLVARAYRPKSPFS
jgi:hypothetical protein